MSRVVKLKNSTTGRLAWGAGRLELNELREEISQALEQGSSAAAIHRELLADNKITLSYRQFRKYASAIKAGLDIEKHVAPLTADAPSSPSLNIKLSEFGQPTLVADQPMSPAAGNSDAAFTIDHNFEMED